MADSKTTGLHLVPSLRYRDAPAAIKWLRDAFGFEEHLVVPGEPGKIVHAQLVCGKAMIMLASPADDDFGRLMAVPGMVGGANTQSVYIVVPDPDAHCTRAKAAGARLVTEVEDQEYGGRNYSCRDPEGHLWSFGNYDPWTNAVAA